jgi:hypothetical protein
VERFMQSILVYATDIISIEWLAMCERTYSLRFTAFREIDKRPMVILCLRVVFWLALFVGLLIVDWYANEE